MSHQSQSSSHGVVVAEPLVPAPRYALRDLHGRTATDLRVSLTDRCHLRCEYCMPPEGLDWMPTDQTLSDEQVIRLVRIGITQLGITDVRFTGGEPLLRRGLAGIIAQTAALTPRPTISITSNALGLKHAAPALAEAGLDRVNISLDTLDPRRFAEMTHRDRWHDVIAGLQAANDAGLFPIKINAVLIRGRNDDEDADLLAWCMEHNYQLRFIEQMPLDAQHSWNRANLVTADEVLASLSQHYQLTPVPGRGAAPAERFWVDGGPHTVGIIGSVTRPFCGDCNRVRLTADGQVRNCLFAREESDLRSALAAGVSDDDIAQRWVSAMLPKRPGHGIDDPSFLQPTRPMSAIGG